jgi:hypothetical protein
MRTDWVKLVGIIFWMTVEHTSRKKLKCEFQEEEREEEECCT